MIARAHEPAPVQPGRAHLAVGRWQLLQHGVVHPLPVRAVVHRAALISPEDDVAGVDHESGAPRLDILHDFARHPFAALEPEHRPAHAGQQLHILDRGLGDPALVHGQRRDFGLGHERHGDADELLGVRIEDELHILLHQVFRGLLGHDQAEKLGEQLDGVGPAGRGRHVHHRSRVALDGKRKSGAGSGLRLLGGRGLRLQSRECKQDKERDYAFHCDTPCILVRPRAHSERAAPALRMLEERRAPIRRAPARHDKSISSWFRAESRRSDGLRYLHGS